MMATNKIDIFLKFEPVVKLVCHNINCRNNLCETEGAYCNFKHLEIDKLGQCMAMDEYKIPTGDETV